MKISRILQVAVASLMGVWCVLAILYASALAAGLILAAASSRTSPWMLAIAIGSTIYLVCLWVLPILIFRKQIAPRLKLWAMILWILQLLLASAALLGAKKYGPSVLTAISEKFSQPGAKMDTNFPFGWRIPQ